MNKCITISFRLPHTLRKMHLWANTNAFSHHFTKSCPGSGLRQQIGNSGHDEHKILFIFVNSQNRRSIKFSVFGKRRHKHHVERPLVPGRSSLQPLHPHGIQSAGELKTLQRSSSQHLQQINLGQSSRKQCGGTCIYQGGERSQERMSTECSVSSRDKRTSTVFQVLNTSPLSPPYR